MLPHMDTAIIVAIIGSTGTVLAALVSVGRNQKSFRDESNRQHSALMSMVELVSDRTDDIHIDLRTVRDNLHDHIAEHAKNNGVDSVVPVRKKAAAKKAK